MTASGYDPVAGSATSDAAQGASLPLGRPTLIDFTLPPTDRFNFSYSPRVLGESVSLGRCILPPNPLGAFVGSTHMTVVIHNGQPFEMAWRLPGAQQLEHQEIVAGDVHIHPANRPVFKRWQGSQTVFIATLTQAFVRQIEMGLFCIADSYIPTLIGVRDTFIASMAQNAMQEMLRGHAAEQPFAESFGKLLAIHVLRSYNDGIGHIAGVKGGLATNRLCRVIRYIDEHLDEDISLLDLAMVTGLTPDHFGAAFKASIGKTPHRYHIERRIHRAKELLLDVTLTVAHVAHDVGFSSQSHFTASFHQITGMSPSEFRRRSV
jgi:AraC family transcriptional regulator